jgi:hypothetical protein
VGSEMCIRDRTTPYVNTATQKNGPGASEETYNIGPNSAQQQASQPVVTPPQNFALTAAPASGPTYTLDGQGTVLKPGITALPSVQPQSVVTPPQNFALTAPATTTEYTLGGQGPVSSGPVSSGPPVISNPWDRMGISQEDYYDNYY